MVTSKEVSAHYQLAPSPQRETMLEMRKRILEIIPNSEEVMSYGMPAFKVNGTVIADFCLIKTTWVSIHLVGQF